MARPICGEGVGDAGGATKREAQSGEGVGDAGGATKREVQSGEGVGDAGGATKREVQSGERSSVRRIWVGVVQAGEQDGRSGGV